MDPLGRDPRSPSARAANRIITSGPQSIATVRSGSKTARPIGFVTTPTSPLHGPVALSTVTLSSMPGSAPQASNSSR